MSQWIPVTSGIPQGSVSGPILFVLFIIDMPSEIKNTCKLFADDDNIFCNPLKTLLQHDINKLSQLPINVKKCKVLHVLVIITHLSHILWKVGNWNNGI